MPTAFDFSTGQWHVDWPGRIAQHNVVYKTPPDDPMRGMPIGNGRLGAIIWFEPNAIVWQMNRCDLFDDCPGDRFTNWGAEEEDKVSTLRHAGQARITFSLPIFDRFYLQDCHGELDISTGVARLWVRSEFGFVSFEALIDYEADVLRFRLEAELSEPDTPSLLLQRYGSRTFSHWYSLVRRDSSIGLLPTETVPDPAAAGLTVQLSGREFSFGGTVSGAAYERVNSCTVEARLASADKQSLTGAIGCTAPVEQGSWDELRQMLAETDWETARDRTADGWREFWQRLYVDYGDDYLNSLYHLALFYLNASQRGSYPGRFINGLWGWNRDVQQWNFYFHWNQQQLYWSACAAGHPELCRSYLELRLRGLEHARRDAEEIFHVPRGAMVSDVTDKEGRNSLAELENHTPVAQIALDLYRYYQYTGDLCFLRERAFEYMVAGARFLRSRFSKGPDGLFHCAPATGYEGWTKLTDVISERSCLQALLEAVLEAADILQADLPERGDYLEVLGSLAPYPQADVAPFTGDDGTLRAGYFAGSPILSPHMLAAGRYAESGELACSFAPSKREAQRVPKVQEIIDGLVRSDYQADEDWYGTVINAGIFPWVELCPIFPAGTIGLSSRGTELHATAVNTARITAPDGMGWSILPIALARLGLADETEAVLATFPERWQWFANGFGHYGPGECMRPESELRFLRREVLDADATDQRFPFEMWPFRHMGLEPLGVFSAAVNEALLQSHEGTIHVFPARNGNAAFTLHAIGGTNVTSQLREGTPCFIALENATGGRAEVANPWETATVYTCHGDPLSTTDARVIELDFSEGETYVLLPGDADWSSVACVPEHRRPNEAPKLSRNGIAMLGLPRMF